MSPLVELTLARLRLFYREPEAVFWTFGFPILLSLALGIAFRNRPPEPVVVAVEESAASDGLAVALRASPNFAVSELPPAAATAALHAGKLALVVVPGDPVTYRFDPTRPESRLARLLVDDTLQRARGRADAFSIREAAVLEPGARYIDFLIPGMIGLNMMSSGMWGIGYVIVETRQKKLLKRMVATPMRRSHFLFSFVAMRMLFLLLELPLLLAFAMLVFDVPLRGSLVTLASVALVGALAFAGMGVLVAARARNSATINGLINLVMLPMFIFSGVFFSSQNFPEVMQPFIRALPLTALNDALRAVMNEGASIVQVAPQLALLSAIGLVAFALGLRFFRWT